MTITLNGTTGITLPNGSASAPAETGTDTDSGVFYGTNTVSIATGGTTAVTVDSSQNVGIGTTSPVTLKSATTLQVNGNLKLGNANDRGLISLGDTASTGANAGIWRGAAGAYGSAGNYLCLGGYDGITFTTGNADIASQTERMRIDGSGNLLVNTTAPTYNEKFKVAAGGAGINTAFLQFTTTDDRDVMIIRHARASGGTAAGMINFQNSSGAQVGSIYSNGTTTGYGTSSDYRLKENIAPMTGALAVVSQLKPCTYIWKADGSSGQGFIAHELQAVIPDAVIGEKDAVETYIDEEGVEQTRPKYQGIDTSFLVATLTAAIQEQQAIISDLKARIETLENK